MCGCRQHFTAPGYGTVCGICEHGNDPAVNIKEWEFFNSGENENFL